MSYVDDLVARKPEVRSFSQYITNNLADNYVRGLNGMYASRLNNGIKAATQPADQLLRIIKALIDDRIKKQKAPSTDKGKKAKPINIDDAAKLSEQQQRALILALWSVRIPVINRNQIIDLVNEGVYGDANYIPPISLSIASYTTADSLPKKQDHQPNLTEIARLLGKLSRKGDSND